MKHIQKLTTRNGNKGTIIKAHQSAIKPVQSKAKIVINKVEILQPLINILTRTSGRPLAFKRCHESVKNQTYKNVRHIVSIDNLQDEEYVKECGVDYFFMDKNVISKEADIPDPKTGPRFIYNLYLNKLIEKVNDGWIIILDDDDYLTDNNVLQKVANIAKSNTDMLLWQMKYPNGGLLPSLQELGKPPRLARIGMPCFAIHSGIAKTIKFDGWKCGDFRFIQKVWAKTVDKRVIREALVSLGSIGLGQRNDIGANINSLNRVSNNPSEISGNAIVKSLKHNIDIKKDYFDFIIITSTYKRNEMLKGILEKITTQQTDYSYKIIVLNDGNNIQEFNEIFNNFENITILHNEKNNGRFYYWKTITTLLKESNKYNFKYLIQLDDDFDITTELFNKLMSLNIKNNEILKLHLDNSSNSKRWGMKKWVDGGTLYTIDFLKKIDFTISEIGLNRWKSDPKKSSGVWEQVSRKANAYNYNILTPNISYFYHLGYNNSEMNKELRKEINIKSINFLK
jgi:hypothetical protein